MVTVAKVVEKIVKENPSLEIMLSKDLISYSKLARYVKAEVKKELGREVKDSAIIVAVKRLQERSAKAYGRPVEFTARNISTHSNLMEVAVLNSPRLADRISRVYSLPEMEEGALLHISEGRNQAIFVFSENIEGKVRGILEGEKMLLEIKGLSQLSITFGKEMLETPGFLVYVLKELAWNGINVVEIISTYTELNIIVESEALTKAYKILERVLFS